MHGFTSHINVTKEENKQVQGNFKFDTNGHLIHNSVMGIGVKCPLVHMQV